MNIRKIIKEEINNSFDWLDEHNYSQEEVIEFIKENKITEWKFMEHWEGDLNLYGTLIEDLGNMESVGGDLFLCETSIQNLGNLESVVGNLFLCETPIQNLGNLESVGGHLDLEGTPISKKYSEQEIRQMIQIGGKLYL